MQSESNNVVNIWGVLVRTRKAVQTMLWPAITEATLRELARNFDTPLIVFDSCESSLGLREQIPTHCKVTRVEVKRDDDGAYLAGLLTGPVHLVERPMSWAYLHNARNNDTGEAIGAKLIALHFSDEPSDA